MGAYTRLDGSLYPTQPLVIRPTTTSLSRVQPTYNPNDLPKQPTDIPTWLLHTSSFPPNYLILLQLSSYHILLFFLRLHSRVLLFPPPHLSHHPCPPPSTRTKASAPITLHHLFLLALPLLFSDKRSRGQRSPHKPDNTSVPFNRSAGYHDSTSRRSFASPPASETQVTSWQSLALDN